MSCGGKLVMDNYLFVFVMNDCRTSLWLSTYLISLYLSLLMMVNAFWMAMCCYNFFLNLGHHIRFYLLCEITCHIAFLFTDIYLFTHTLVAPQGLQNLGGAFVLRYANHV